MVVLVVVVLATARSRSPWCEQLIDQSVSCGQAWWRFATDQTDSPGECGGLEDRRGWTWSCPDGDTRLLRGWEEWLGPFEWVEVIPQHPEHPSSTQEPRVGQALRGAATTTLTCCSKCRPWELQLADDTLGYPKP